MKYRKLNRWKYQLVEPLEIKTGFTPPNNIETEFISLNIDGALRLKNYYAWDGASGPCFDTPRIMKGSLVHDALYQLMRLGLLERSYRKFADQALKQICLQNGMNKFWAEVVYWGVRILAYAAVLPTPETPYYELP